MHSSYTYVTWVIKEVAYVGGALALGASLRRVDPEIPRVLLISYDLVSPSVLFCAKRVFTHVIEVPYIEKTFEHKWQRFRDFYQWLNLCMTRMYAFKAIHEVFGNNTKFLIMDADMLVLHSMKGLFAYNTPAGTCSVVDHKEFLSDENVPDGRELMGGKLEHKLVQYAIDKFWGMKGCVYLFDSTDGTAVFNSMIEKLKDFFPGSEKRIGPDELFFSEYFNKEEGWTHIPACFSNVSWVGDDEYVQPHKWMRALHYVSQKPWWTGPNFQYWDDFDLWYSEVSDLVDELPEAIHFYNKILVEKQNKKIPRKASNLSNMAGLDRMFIEKKNTMDRIQTARSIHTHVDLHLQRIVLDDEGKVRRIPRVSSPQSIDSRDRGISPRAFLDRTPLNTRVSSFMTDSVGRTRDNSIVWEGNDCKGRDGNTRKDSVLRDGPRKDNGQRRQTKDKNRRKKNSQITPRNSNNVTDVGQSNNELVGQSNNELSSVVGTPDKRDGSP